MVPGVYEHPTIESFYAQSAAWEQAAIESARARVQQAPKLP
jgi:hypothetical protein